MAKVILINNETEADGLQYLGDLVDVYEDDRWMSPTMLEKFSILTINGSVEDVKARLRQLQPRTAWAYLWGSDSKWHWTKDGSNPPAETIEVFQAEGSNRWYRLENDFKFPVNLAALTPEEKQLLETVNINHPSVDSFIRKLIKDITALSGNDIEIKNLRNTQP